MPGLRALLLDLDDTLLINDMETFAPGYFRALLHAMRAVSPPVRFMEALQTGTEAMMRNDGRDGTNEQVFMREFLPRIERRAEEMEPLFRRFYREEFDALRPLTAVDPDARRLVTLARERGYQVAIATQPIFPREAILARLRWAEVPDEEFHYDLITSFEVMHACKPHRAFFRAVLERLGRRPEECLMVGDSVGADLGAGRLGIRTFWVDRGRGESPRDVRPDARGSLADLIRLIETGEIDERS